MNAPAQLFPAPATAALALLILPLLSIVSNGRAEASSRTRPGGQAGSDVASNPVPMSPATDPGLATSQPVVLRVYTDYV